MSAGGPYVGLDYFLEEDAGLFFGRDAERKRIIGNLRASRLTLLYAESGVGKSSLLRAGVSARLRQFAAGDSAERRTARFVPVVFSAWQGELRDDLIAAIGSAVRPLLDEDTHLALRRDALESAIEDAAAAADATLLIILDQFEERFLYEIDDGFDDELAHCINRRDLRANFLISVREDAYPLIGPRFKSRIANVYGNYLHLDFLEAGAARDAVVRPVVAYNRLHAADGPRFEIDDALVDAVLNQVRRGRVTIGDGEAPDVRDGGPARVETAYLQLVMKRLWDEESAAGSQRLRLETLRRLGGADTIVHGHLDDVMDELSGDQRDAAATAFRFLVTSSGRKIALSAEELREFSDAPSAALGPALEHLERERILRPIPAPEPGGVTRHELYHDVLAPAILDWRRRHHTQQTERGLVLARERARRLEVRNRRLAAAVIALAAVGVALALYVWNPGPVQRLELGTVDARFSVRGAQSVDPRLALIAVDDNTLARLHPEGNPRILRRGAYARMLNRLNQDRPTAIALDVLFEAPSNSGDGALSRAIRATGERLVLASRNYAVQFTDGGQTLFPELFIAPESLKAAGVNTGYPGLPHDVDGHNRRGDYLVELFRPAASTAEIPADETLQAKTFAFSAVNVVRGGRLLENVDDLPTAPRRVNGEQSEYTNWIDYAGPPGTVRPVSALDVLEGRVPAGTFAGKIVVVGVISRRNTDWHPTPMDRGRSMSGPEVQANAINTILHGGPLRDVSRSVDILAILLLACVPALASLIASRAVGIAAIVGAAVAFLVVAQLTFNAGRVLAVALPLVALAVSAACVAALVAARTVRRRRARASTAPLDGLSSL